MVQNLDKVMMVFMIVFLMLGMGASLSGESFSEVLKSPKAFIIGLLSQFLIMPTLAFALAITFSFPTHVSIGLILVGCTPGGSLSNIFAYYSRGNLALSISMTTCSSIAAFFMMPSLLYLFGQHITTESLKIPYESIARSLALVVIPVLIGMLIKNKNESIALKVEKVSSKMGVLLIIGVLILWTPRFMKITADFTIIQLCAIYLLASFGFIFSYLLSKLLKLPLADRKSISIETGVQNIPLTFAIIVLSFSKTDATMITTVPFLYGTFAIINIVFISFIFRRMK